MSVAFMSLFKKSTVFIVSLGLILLLSVIIKLTVKNRMTMETKPIVESLYSSYCQIYGEELMQNSEGKYQEGAAPPTSDYISLVISMGSEGWPANADQEWLVERKNIFFSRLFSTIQARDQSEIISLFLNLSIQEVGNLSQQEAAACALPPLIREVLMKETHQFILANPRTIN